MATEYPEFGSKKKLKAIREAYGLTQVDLCNELALSKSYVSMYESDSPALPEYAGKRIEAWMDEQ